MFIEQPPWFYRALFPGVIWRIPAKKKCVYLTFDDGPIPEVTPWVLDILDKYGVKATFFCVGDNVRKHPDIYQMILDRGHRVGNHTFNHIQGIRFWTKNYLANVEKAAEYIKSDLFRPPHGHMRFPQVVGLRRHYRIIMWDVVTRDYSPHMTPNGVFNVVKNYPRNGSVIVFHDSLKAERNMREAMPRAIEWLQDYLTDYKGSLLLISHDRYFLDHVCTTMGELLGGKMIKFTGNYTEYMKKRTADFETRMKAYELQQKEIQREQAIIERYRSFNREKSIKAAESREKRLAKVERLEKPVEEQHVRFSFDARRRSGEEALEVRELSKSFEGQPVFQNLSFKLRTGDRVALIGPNGVGKSTLFRILTHQINPDHGSVRFGTNIDIGYYDQHQQNLNPQNTILDEVWNAFPKLEQTRIRSALGLFLFTGDEVFEKIEKLSGGERGRVALTKLMLKQDNLLLLDEPTNHLDMDSREVLEDALRDFPGTILAISHDRYFINRFAEKVMVMEKDSVTEYLGNFDDYIEKRDRPRPPVSSLEDEPTRTAQTREKKKTRQQNALLRELKAAVDKAEAAIEQNEREMARLEAELARPETYNDLEAMRRLTESYQAEQDKTESLYEALEAAETALSEASEN